MQKELEDTKGVIRVRKSKKDRQHIRTNTPRSVNRNLGLIAVYEWSWNRKQK
jgi:transcription termination factor NusB